jgi:hypothetical protein
VTDCEFDKYVRECLDKKFKGRSKNYMKLLKKCNCEDCKKEIKYWNDFKERKEDAL